MQSGLKIEGVQDIIAVASGKGGVGKSTTAGKRVPLFLTLSSSVHQLFSVHGLGFALVALFGLNKPMQRFLLKLVGFPATGLGRNCE